MPRPKWLDNAPSTRSRSKKQEVRVAKTHGGLPTINSGATFSQNDVETPEFSFECKTTQKKSYVFKLEEFRKAQERTPVHKIPVFQVDFEREQKSFVTLREEDFLALLEELNQLR